MKQILIIAFLFSFSLHAQEVANDPARPTIGAAGQIFTVKITPKIRRIEVSFVESPLVTLDPEQLTIRGKIIPLQGKSRNLKLATRGKHVELLEPLTSGSRLELQIEEKGSKKSETLQIHSQP